MESAPAYPVPVSAEDGVRTITLENAGTIESVECMELVLNSIVNHQLAHLNRLQPMEYGISVRVYMKDVNEGRSINNQEFVEYSFPADQIPKFVKDAFDYDKRLSKNISYGLNIPIEK